MQFYYNKMLVVSFFFFFTIYYHLLLLTRKLLNQGFLVVKLNSSLQKFCGCHHDLVNRYGVHMSQLTTYMFHLSKSQITISSFMIYYRVCDKSSTNSATYGAETAYLSGEHDFTTRFSLGFVLLDLYCPSLYPF